MADEIDEAIADAALAPQETDVDGTKTVERPLPDLIEFDRYRKSQAAAKVTNPFNCLRTARARFRDPS